MQQKANKTIINSKVRDSGGKIIFEDNTLCSQFLRDYIDLPYLKNVRPEDIEDYYLVPLRDYSNEELLDRADEISVVMLINKLQSQKDIAEFRKISPQKLQDVLQETPGYLVDIIANVLLAFLLEEKVPVPEAQEMVGMVKEKKMARLFENMEKIDIPAERRKNEAERHKNEADRKGSTCSD